jgi:hypothetical protein
VIFHRCKPGIVAALLFCCLLLAGCAGKLPRTYPLTVSEREQVLTRLDDFMQRRCSGALDADVTLEMRFLGKTETAPGMLQALPPSYLRYTVADPLGRSLAILVSDGSTFIMVDNRNAEAVTGPVDSAFWNEFVPAGIFVEDIIPWLSGRLSDQDLKITGMYGDRDDPALVWLNSAVGDGLKHEIGFNCAEGIIRRHIIKNDIDGTVVLDVTYTRYDRKDMQCPVPLEIVVEGRSITGTLTIRFDRIFTDSTLSPRIFQLDLPDHYTVSEVE